MGLGEHDHGRTAGRRGRSRGPRRGRRRRCGPRPGTGRAARAWRRGSPARRRRPRRTTSTSPSSAIRMPTRVGARSAISSRSRSVKGERPRAPSRLVEAGGRSAGRRARPPARACCAGRSPRAGRARAGTDAAAVVERPAARRRARCAAATRSRSAPRRAEPRWRSPRARSCVTFSRSPDSRSWSRLASTAIAIPNRSRSSWAIASSDSCAVAPAGSDSSEIVERESASARLAAITTGCSSPSSSANRGPWAAMKARSWAMPSCRSRATRRRSASAVARANPGVDLPLPDDRRGQDQREGNRAEDLARVDPARYERAARSGGRSWRRPAASSRSPAAR